MALFNSGKSHTEEENREVNMAIQHLGLQFMVNMQTESISNVISSSYNERFSYFVAKIHNRLAVVYVMTVMYPQDFRYLPARFSSEILKSAKSDFDLSGIDLYAMGLGLINKNAPENERGVYKENEKYSVALGDISMLSPSSDGDFGHTDEFPVRLPSIESEYIYLKHVQPDFGRIVSCERVGSCPSAFDYHMIDAWEMAVETDDETPLYFRYTFYLDPYNPKVREEESRKTPFWLKWVD